jgi:nicotinate-nucleotide pyrophosphorylase (carboxylating)
MAMEPQEDLTGLDVVEQALARLAILEDLGERDLTAAVLPEDHRSEAVIRARQDGVLSGTGPASAVFRAVDDAIEVTPLLATGERFAAGREVLRARGRTRSLLTAERAALNFLQHLSGVATRTAQFVDVVAGTGVRITDTRKTVPGLRLLEKEAVVHGGGVNHRLGLYDAVMIKDNHIDAAGGITAAVEAARRAWAKIPLIVEARSRAEAEEAAGCGAGRILLDNMEPEEVAACVDAIEGIAAGLAAPGDDEKRWRWLYGTWRPGDRVIQIEVSGGIRLANARSYALPGVDFLAVGEITHSAPACDLAMDLRLGA